MAVLLPHPLPGVLHGSRCLSFVLGVRRVPGHLSALVPAVSGSLAAGAVALGGRSSSLSVSMAPRALASGRARLDAAVKQIMPKCK